MWEFEVWVKSHSKVLYSGEIIGQLKAKACAIHMNNILTISFQIELEGNVVTFRI